MKYNNIELYANKPAPLLNNHDFNSIFNNNMPLDRQNLLKALELIALPGSKLHLRGKHGNVFEVSMPGYPKEGLFVDRRFVSEKRQFPEPQMPKKELILNHMVRCKGKPYIWGGNYSPGIPEMLVYYPPKGELGKLHRNTWTFAGVDCSGLLYEACHGLTPRNTSLLVKFGEERKIEELRPLDLLVWNGHVVIALDQNHTIESRVGKGVIICDLKKRLKEIETDLKMGRIKKLSVRRFL